MKKFQNQDTSTNVIAFLVRGIHQMVWETFQFIGKKYVGC